MDHSTLVRALKDPSAFPHAVDRVEYLQTHISSVFLTGERVYKLKKPVNFGFYCEAEVELNRRLAPSVYLGVEPVTAEGDTIRVGGGGEVVDWVVVMRQLDQDLLGLRVLERGELGDGHVDALIELLVPFYRNAATGEDIDRYGTVEAVKFNTDENFLQTEAYVGKLLSRERFDHIRRWTDRFYDDNAALMERRIAEGRIRESHGDLHLGNIFFTEPPVVFDCIEFNERFRCGDVAVDLAFLAMDLDYHGRPVLADRLIGGYVAESGDTELPALMDFYRCYRAYVRGKVSCFSSSDPSLSNGEKRRFRNQARRYFGLAYHYAGGTARPSLVVLLGLMGSGKTSLARYVREHYGWHVLSTDAVRKQLAGIGEDTRVYVPYGEGLYSEEMNLQTYAELCRRAENLLLGGFPVVVDGAFKSQFERQPLVELAERAGADLLFIETTCSPEEQRRRLERRQRHDTRSDGRVELMEAQRRDWQPPALDAPGSVVQLTTDGPPEETCARLSRVLEARGVVEEA